jgi:tetratricopeptide (TPR) repeat protein
LGAESTQHTTGLFYETLIQSYIEAPHFVKRVWLAEQLEEALVDPGCRFLLLTAEPGAGKTAFSAWLAHRHSGWPRYFIRRDSQTPLSSGDARSFLFAVGHQLAAMRPSLFRSEQLEIVVKQRVGGIQKDGKAVGIQVEDLKVSPFYQTALKVEQDVQIVAGELVGISIKRMVTEKHFLETGNLQYLALLDPATALLKEDPEARIVLLVDALDELRYHPGQDNILKWLAACPRLPDNVRIVLTSRPDEMLNRFKRSQQQWLREATIDPRSEQVKADLRHYAVGFTAQDSVKNALIEQEVDADDFTTQSVTKAKGNFQYLAALFRGITQAIEMDEQEQLHRLLSGEDVPTELEELYAFFLTLIKDSVADEEVEVRSERRKLSGKANLQPAWEWLYQPILGILAVAKEPLNTEQIQAFGAFRVHARWLSSALGRLGQFLDQDHHHYRLYHSSFAEFLTSSQTKAAYDHCYFDPLEWHSRIADHYRNEAPTWENVHWSQVDDYGMLHLAQHLYALKDDRDLRPELYSLICAPFMWEKQARFGSHHAFATDVALAIQVAQTTAPPNMVEIIKGSVLLGTLGKLAGDVPPEVPGVMAYAGQAARARSYAALMPAGPQQDLAYSHIAEGLLANDEVEAAQEALQGGAWSLEHVEGIVLKEKAKLLAQVGEYCQAIDLVKSLGSSIYRAESMQAIVEIMMQAGEFDLLLTATTVLGVPTDTSEALDRVVAVLVQAGKNDEALAVINRLLVTVKRSDDVQYKEMMFGAIARVMALAGESDLALTLLETEFAEIKSTSSVWSKNSAHVGIALATIKTGQIERGLQETKRITNAYVKDGALCNATQILVEAGEVERASAVAQSIGSATYKAQALAEVAVALALQGAVDRAQNVTEQALRLAEIPSGSTNEPEALRAVVRALVYSCNLDTAIATAERIRARNERVAALNHIARELACAGEAAQAAVLAQRSLEIIGSIGESWRKRDLWSDMARTLTLVGELGQALAIAEEDMLDQGKTLEAIAQAIFEANMHIDGDRALAVEQEDRRWHRDSTMSKVAQALARAGDYDQALAIARGLTFQSAEALKGVAQSMAQAGDTDQALVTAAMIAEAWQQANTLAAIALTLARRDDKKRALDIVDQVVRLVERDVNLGNVEARYGIGIALAQVGAFDWALEVAASLTAEPVKYLRIEMLREIFRHLVDSRSFDRGLSILNTIEDDYDLYQVLSVAVQSLTQVGEVDQAETAADRLGSEGMGGHYRTILRSEIAHTLVQMGQPAQALSFLDPDKATRETGETVGEAAKCFAESGDRPGVEQALAKARAIDYSPARAVALSDVSQALTQIGDKSLALEVAHQALAAAQATRDRYALLARVALALALADDKRAAEITDQALIELEKGEMVEIKEFLEIVRVLAEMKSADGLRQALSEAVKYSFSKGEDAMTATAEALVALEGLDRTLVTMQEIAAEKETATPGGGTWIKVYMVGGMARALAQTKSKSGLHRLLAEVEAFRPDYSHQAKSRALGEIAEALARIADMEGLRRAAAIAGGIKHSHWQAQALAGVTQAMAEIGGFAEALQTVDRISDQTTRAKTLGQIARSLAQAGRQEQAQTVWFSALETARVAHISSLYDVLKSGASMVASIDQGQTLWRAYKTMGETEAWWGR